MICFSCVKSTFIQSTSSFDRIFFQFSPMFLFSSIHFQCSYRPDAQSIYRFSCVRSIFIQSTFSFDLSRIFFHFRACSCFLPFIFNAYTDQTLNLPDVDTVFYLSIYLPGSPPPVSIGFRMLIRYSIYLSIYQPASQPASRERGL